jgi:magnesium transporter
MRVLRVSPDGVERRSPAEVGDLLADRDALVWVDMPHCDPQAVTLLEDVFGFHHRAVANCVERNHMSKVHIYPDHVFTVMHAPHIGQRGHVHYVELDQFVGPNFLVTVHGPLNPLVPAEVADLDTGAVARRLENGSLTVEHAYEISYAIAMSLGRREIDLVAQLAQESGRLEQSVTSQETRKDPESFVEDLFETWYELLAVRTMAAHTAATYGRIAAVTKAAKHPARAGVIDVEDQFTRITQLADGQREFLHGVIEFYKTRAETHTTIAAERMAATGVQQNDDMRRISAWVAIIAVPTAVTGFMGQNVPYPGFGTPQGFYASSTVMILMAIVLYTFFRRKKWL